MASWPPKKNSIFTVTFPIYDNDGDPVSGAAGLDSEVSIDGGTFADCTNEASEIATSSGIYELDLTASEMNGDRIVTVTKTSTGNAKSAVNVMYTAVQQIDDVASSASISALNDLSAANVQSELVTYDASTGAEVAALNDLSAADVATELGTYDAPTKAELDSGFAALNDIAAADVWSVVTRELTGLGFVLGAGDIAADAIGSSELADAAANKIADAILKRDMDQVEATAALHSLATAILKAVSKIEDAAGTLKVYRTDGTTLHMSQTIGTDASLDPVDSLTVGA